MPRYMDADKFKEHIASFTGLFTEEGFMIDYQAVLTAIDNASAAEVVPKSEVEDLPCVAYNKKHERYQVIHKGKQGHIFASKLYRNRREAENALAELKKRNTRRK